VGGRDLVISILGAMAWVFVLLCEFSELLCTYVGDSFYGYVTSRFYRLSTVVVDQCFALCALLVEVGFSFGGGPRSLADSSRWSSMFFIVSFRWGCLWICEDVCPFIYECIVE
jgi:hypothetical protein